MLSEARRPGAGARTEYERDGNVDSVFAQRVLERPTAVAIADGSGSRTFEELDRQASRIANRLIQAGVQPGGTVGVAFERSLDLPGVLLGILRAGAAYVPLDAAYPPERLALMIADAAVSLVVAHEGFPLPSLPVRTIDTAELSAPGDETRPLALRRPDSLAYVTYTSGSTGTPKGVAIEDRGILRLVRGTDFVDIEPADIFLHFAPLAFDASTFEIWAPLLNGARLAVPAPGLPAMSELAAIIDRFGVTVLWLTAALFARFVDSADARPRSLRYLVAGGDAISPSHARRFLEAFPDCHLINGYGPTENTTFSTWHPISLEDTALASIPIGRPIANSSAYVLDATMRPVPEGAIGDLWVGGDGVARGYVNQPELNAERFVPDPNAGEPGARMYRTGDRAALRADGILEFHGRADDQVKVRGFRIELGEIEAALKTYRGVGDAAVVIFERESEKDLVAQVVAVPGALVDERELRAHLTRSLPPFMLPHRIAVRAELPLLPSGKVDRIALARETQAQAGSAAPSVAAPPQALRLHGGATRLERAIGELWRDVLRTEREPALDENFFDAGGDSLRLLSVQNGLRERLNVQLSMTDLFELTTIRRLAAFLAQERAAT